MTEFLSLDALAASIPDGAHIAIPPDYSGVAMAATRALIRRGAKGLKLLSVPTAGLQADLLIGAGCVAEIETAGIALGEAGSAPRFRDAVGRLARDHVRAHHDLGATSDRLSAFLADVHARKAKLLESLVTRRAPEGSLLSYLLDEVRRAALDLGLSGVPVGFEPLLDDLAPERP